MLFEKGLLGTGTNQRSTDDEKEKSASTCSITVHKASASGEPADKPESTVHKALEFCLEFIQEHEAMIVKLRKNVAETSGERYEWKLFKDINGNLAFLFLFFFRRGFGQKCVCT